MGLWALFEGTNMTFTIDTGATKSFISERIYYSVPISQRPILNQTNGLTDVTGQPLPQFGAASE